MSDRQAPGENNANSGPARLVPGPEFSNIKERKLREIFEEGLAPMSSTSQAAELYSYYRVDLSGRVRFC